ncbi:hypothetical protein AC579_120 [Pseudocercospora musae]|uniref:FAD-binding FR-type domain-containing protein n=1 Tax=Pseudocercospora musae TaxID=113226 RepID=A0A139ILR1_9PEZI|nr:hypothetical protein AC579_120 [Pseudocercospora musae]
MSAGAQSPAAAAAEQRREQLFAEWLARNHSTARYWAAAMGGLIGLFVVSHWSQRLYSKHLSRKPNALRATVRAIARPVQRLSTARSLGPVTILPGKFTLALVYFAINAALTFYDSPQKAAMKTMLSKRFGWMSLLNLLLTIFLGLKNTPLSPLAGYSFDSLNVLHRCVGYTTILYMILHSTTYTAFLFKSGFQSVLAEPKEYAGAVSGFAMLALLATSIGPVRNRVYEVFYTSHIILVAIIIVALGLHRPEYMLKAFTITTLASTLWLFDQTLRFSRWIYHNSIVTLHPLSGSTTLVKFSDPISAASGSSVFLWIPSIKQFQRHPFTLVTNSPRATFLVKSRDGFTKALYETACANPGAQLRASIEGPYGHVPNVHENFSKVVLIAGGSGVTFTMALALEWIRKRKTPKDMRKLEFWWCVRDLGCMEWFGEEFNELRQETERVSVRVFCTGIISTGEEGSDESETSSLEKESIGGDEVDKLGVGHLNLSRVAVRGSGEEVRRDVGCGRPDVRGLVSGAIEGLSEDERVLVAACGPEGLLNDVRRAVAVSRVAKAPSIEVFLEEFSF